MSIEYTLSRAQADALFDANAILFGETNGIPEYRIVELFGDWAGAFVEGNILHNGYLVGGKDWNGWGDCCAERPMIHYLYRSGFLKVVSEHNYRLALASHRDSDGGKVVDTLWQARRDRIAAQDAEDERKREERRAKRAAARKAKEAMV